MSSDLKDPKDLGNSNKPQKRTIVDILFDGLEWCYKKFMRFVSLNDDDPVLLVIFKIIARAIGILIMVALSPFIIIGIFITIMVVS